jgi:hypothetical protein
MKKRRRSKADESAPATKLDVRLLMEQMGTYYSNTERRIVESEQRSAKRLLETERHLRKDFSLFSEIVGSDLVGANNDRFENHEMRISRLESKVGVLD